MQATDASKKALPAGPRGRFNHLISLENSRSIAFGRQAKGVARAARKAGSNTAIAYNKVYPGNKIGRPAALVQLRDQGLRR
jgi:hypothetical protein